MGTVRGRQRKRRKVEGGEGGGGRESNCLKKAIVESFRTKQKADSCQGEGSREKGGEELGES